MASATSTGVSARTLYLIATLVAFVVPLVVFSPALWNGFVWDDQVNFETNSGYRGLGWSQLRWMFTNTVEAHWIPLTWVTFGVDYVLWGMNPAGYHLTSLLFHAINTWLFFLIALRLLRLAGSSTDRSTLIIGASAATLFFSIHPLRAESVAWVTERRDVVSGFFFFVAVLAYLFAREPGRDKPGCWSMISLISFQAAVLSKSIVVTLPFVLLLLDIYPLKRLAPSPLRWARIENRRVLLEKLPFLPLPLLAGVVATSIIGGLNRFTPLSLSERLATVVYSFSFYPWKTVVPVHLSPLYEFPAAINPTDPRFIVAAAAFVVVTAFVVALARRWPAGLIAWLAYLVMIGPVSGVRHTGVQLVADRYSYLSCLPWALLFGAAVCVVVRARKMDRLTHARWRLISAGFVTWLIVLAGFAAQQTTIWRDSEVLWRYATESDPQCFVCEHNLGTTLLTNGRTTEAIAHLERATELRPPATISHAALVVGYLAVDAPHKAYEHLEAVKRSDRELARDLRPFFVTTW